MRSQKLCNHLPLKISSVREKKALKNQSINKLIKYRQSMSRRMYNVSLNKKICR